MERMNWGVIGCGGIATKFAGSLAALEKGTLLAAASRTPGKAAEYAENHGVERVYTDYASLAADPDVDIVYVATTHNFHHENVKLCLENGKHVLCEKPFTVNARQAEELIALARANRLFLMEALWTRFLPAIRKMKTLIDDGAIGEARTVQSSFCINPERDETHRLKNKALAGGALLDLGVYPINLAALVFGEQPEKITSSAEIGPTGVDYGSFYHFDYAGGRRAILHASCVETSPSSAVVQGTKGYIQLPPFFHGSTEFTLHVKDEAPRKFEFPCPAGHEFKYEIAEVMERVAAGKLESGVMPLSETLAIMKTMDAIRAQWGLKYEGE